MFMRVCRTAGTLLSVLLLVAAKSPAAIITVVSGTNVTFFGGPLFGDFSAPTLTADLAANPATGTTAVVLTPPNAAYISNATFQSLSSSTAVWIGVASNAGTSNQAGESALYAVTFNVPAMVIGSATLALDYAVDNQLGISNAGLFLNGTALPSSTGIGEFTTFHTYSDNNIGSLLHVGSNTLYFNDDNIGTIQTAAGLIFKATITIPDDPVVPEPGTIGMGAAGLLALLVLRFRVRRGSVGR